jgi:2-dehydropantoate 2-reductase
VEAGLMKIAVFGTGGVGGYFGGRLAQSGQDVVFIARGTHKAAIAEHGLRVESIDGDFTISPATVVDDPARAGKVDTVIVATKAWQVPEAAARMAPLLGPETFVVPLENGVDSLEQLAQVLGSERVLGGTCRLSAYLAEPGLIRHVGTLPWLAFGEMDNRPSARAQLLLDAFAGIPQIRAEIPADIQAVMWDKFVYISAVSTVCSVARQPMGVVRSFPETRGLLMAAVQETTAVGKARGVALPGDLPEKAMERIDRTEAAVIPSMQRDVMEGRPSELESMSGAVSRMGREMNIPTPAHDFLYAALLPQERAARERS